MNTIYRGLVKSMFFTISMIALASVASAKTFNVMCPTADDRAAIQAAVDQAHEHDTIKISGNCVLNTNTPGTTTKTEIDIKKSNLTITGNYKDSNKNGIPDANDSWGTTIRAVTDQFPDQSGFFVKPGNVVPPADQSDDSGTIPVSNVMITGIKFSNMNNIATGVSSNGAKVSNVTFTKNFYTGVKMPVMVFGSSGGTMVNGNLINDASGDASVLVFSNIFSGGDAGISIVKNIFTGNGGLTDFLLYGPSQQGQVVAFNKISTNSFIPGLLLGAKNAIVTGNKFNNVSAAFDMMITGTEYTSIPCESSQNKLLGNQYTANPPGGVNVVLDGALGPDFNIDGCPASTLNIHNNQVINLILPALIADYGNNNIVIPQAINN